MSDRDDSPVDTRFGRSYRAGARSPMSRPAHCYLQPEHPVSNCLFCSIVEGAIPGDVVLETDDVVAFRDISPQAPTHVLVIPKRHVASLADTSAVDSGLLGSLLEAAVTVARQEGLTGGFRTVINTGDDGGQTVHHLHVHVLGGRRLSWPPG